MSKKRKSERREEVKGPVLLTLPAFLRYVKIKQSTTKYLVQHYDGQIKPKKEWQAVLEGIKSNPVT